MSHPPCDRVVVAFELNQRPHPKGRPRFGKTHAYTDAKTREYEKDVKDACLEAMKGRPPYAGYCELVVLFEQKDAKVADVDNLAKAVQDGINKTAFVDDKQVTRLTAARKIRADVNRVSVAVLAVTK